VEAPWAGPFHRGWARPQVPAYVLPATAHRGRPAFVPATSRNDGNGWSSESAGQETDLGDATGSEIGPENTHKVTSRVDTRRRRTCSSRLTDRPRSAPMMSGACPSCELIPARPLRTVRPFLRSGDYRMLPWGLNSECWGAFGRSSLGRERLWRPSPRVIRRQRTGISWLPHLCSAAGAPQRNRGMARSPARKQQARLLSRPVGTPLRGDIAAAESYCFYRFWALLQPARTTCPWAICHHPRRRTRRLIACRTVYKRSITSSLSCRKTGRSIITSELFRARKGYRWKTESRSRAYRTQRSTDVRARGTTRPT
jgi:hypothetical protein